MILIEDSWRKDDISQIDITQILIWVFQLKSCEWERESNSCPILAKIQYCMYSIPLAQGIVIPIQWDDTG